MGKLVVLKLGSGDFERGFLVTLQIGEDGEHPFMEIAGHLPPDITIPQHYKRWHSAYCNLELHSRIKVPARAVTNVSCHEEARTLSNSINTWLNSDGFRSIREGLLKNLNPSEEIRVIIQTEDIQLRKLPWQVWSLFSQYYTKAEIALSNLEYERAQRAAPATFKDKVRILAILGTIEGIDVQKDRQLLESLPDVVTTFLVEPQRQQIVAQLWDHPWDILFFAGHSQTEDAIGRLYINQTDSLTIDDLKNALKKSIAGGLRLAIFNCCDGLGLACGLADLHIPQVVVMRELVPDLVAQEFLKCFLTAFAKGNSLYSSVKEARERLQGLEDRFPCATWLPVIYQNPAEVPLTWKDLTGSFAKSELSPAKKHLKLRDNRKIKERASSRSHCILGLGGLAAVALLLDERVMQSWQGVEASKPEITIKISSRVPTTFKEDSIISPDDKSLFMASASPDYNQAFKSLGTKSFRPDGKTQVVASNDNTIHFWRLGGKELKTPKVYSFRSNPEGKILASASRDNTAQGCSDGVKQRERKLFIITGAGRLPTRLGDAYVSPYSAGTVRSLLSSTPSSDSSRSSVLDSVYARSWEWESFTNSTSSMPTLIIEASGWVINNKGEVVLTVAAPTASISLPWLSSC